MRIPQRFSVSLLLALAAIAAHADGTLQPVPTPDTSKMAAAAAKKIVDERAVIDKAKANLVGPPLAQAYADLGALYGATDSTRPRRSRSTTLHRSIRMMAAGSTCAA